MREKIERQSGVIHWSKQVGRNEINFRGRCLDFIYLEDNNLMARPDSTAELQDTDDITPDNVTIKVKSSCLVNDYSILVAMVHQINNSNHVTLFPKFPVKLNKR